MSPTHTHTPEAEALLASLDPEEREAVLAALAKKKRRAEKAARLEQAEVGRGGAVCWVGRASGCVGVECGGGG